MNGNIPVTSLGPQNHAKWVFCTPKTWVITFTTKWRLWVRMDVDFFPQQISKRTNNFNVIPAAIVANMLSPKDRSTDEQCFSRLMKYNWQLPQVNKHSNGKVLFSQQKIWLCVSVFHTIHATIHFPLLSRTYIYILNIHVLVYWPHVIFILNKHVGTYFGPMDGYGHVFCKDESVVDQFS